MVCRMRGRTSGMILGDVGSVGEVLGSAGCAWTEAMTLGWMDEAVAALVPWSVCQVGRSAVGEVWVMRCAWVGPYEQQETGRSWESLSGWLVMWARGTDGVG